MIRFVIVLDSAQNGLRIRHAGLIYRDRLEAALQGRIFFDVFSVFSQRSSANNLNLAAGKCGLKDVGRIHTALRIAGSDDVVHFINYENDVACTFHVRQQSHHTGFKLTAELGAGYESRQIHQANLIISQFVRHVAVCDSLRQRFSNSGFTNAGLTDQARIVLLTTAKDLYNTVQLALSADNAIQFTVFSTGCQIMTIRCQKLSFFLFGRGFFLTASPILRLHKRNLHSSAEQLLKINSRCAALTGQFSTGSFPVIGCLLGRVIRGSVRGIQLVSTHIFHKILHFGIHSVQILITEAHIGNNIIHGFNTQFFCTLDAQPVLLRNPIVQMGNKNNGHAFFTSGTHYHKIHLRLRGAQPFTRDLNP